MQNIKLENHCPLSSLDSDSQQFLKRVGIYIHVLVQFQNDSNGPNSSFRISYNNLASTQLHSNLKFQNDSNRSNPSFRIMANWPVRNCTTTFAHTILDCQHLERIHALLKNFIFSFEAPLEHCAILIPPSPIKILDKLRKYSLKRPFEAILNFFEDHYRSHTKKIEEREKNHWKKISIAIWGMVERKNKGRGKKWKKTFQQFFIICFFIQITTEEKRKKRKKTHLSMKRSRWSAPIQRLFRENITSQVYYHYRYIAKSYTISNKPIR